MLSPHLGDHPYIDTNPLSWGLQPSKPPREGDVPKQVLVGTVKVACGL